MVNLDVWGVLTNSKVKDRFEIIDEGFWDNKGKI
jgi:hypothetical protein